MFGSNERGYALYYREGEVNYDSPDPQFRYIEDGVTLSDFTISGRQGISTVKFVIMRLERMMAWPEIQDIMRLEKLRCPDLTETISMVTNRGWPEEIGNHRLLSVADNVEPRTNDFNDCGDYVPAINAMQPNYYRLVRFYTGQKYECSFLFVQAD